MTVRSTVQGSLVRAFVVGFGGVFGSGALASALGVMAQTLIVWAGI